MKTNMKKRLAAIAIAACTACTICASPVSAAYNSSTVTQRDALSTAYQTYFMCCEKYKFPAGKYWNHNIGHADECTDTPCKRDSSKAPLHDACGYVSNGVVVGPGLQKLSGVATIAHQCAGFARKLSMDFTGGGKVYVRTEMTKNFQVRVGDMIRIRCYGSNNTYSDHSIFVTEVNGNTFKFADCNWTGDCKIRWDVAGSIHNGTLMIGQKVYTTLYVDRPLMAGDVNGDCVVDGNDVSIVNQICNGTYKFKGAYEKYVRQVADVNNDGYVTTSDRYYMLQAMSGNPNYRLGFLTYIQN
ncbi:MAG: dockerin type I repeat-containing protein [Oscillospiraceae bacterium]|nr:dockerin type I repeat-containing protein [Oscillospiraceae bacterium]